MLFYLIVSYFTDNIHARGRGSSPWVVERVSDISRNVCDVWLVPRLTYGYLPNFGASPLFREYKLHCLVTEAQVCERLVRTVCTTAQCVRIEPGTSRSPARRSNHTKTGRTGVVNLFGPPILYLFTFELRIIYETDEKRTVIRVVTLKLSTK